MASIALAEATLIIVSEDDPSSISKVRAHLFARICLAAAGHAGQRQGLLGPGKINADLVKYAGDLRKPARGKAARLLAIDAELSGKTGEGLAWLQGARNEFGLTFEVNDGQRKDLIGLNQSWQERREDKRIEKGGNGAWVRESWRILE
ncbi:hypothetical protein LTR17_020165 [Elasticomyces elasticus]|nr:hypothetical protein LTR17_020165 [Elasticomyces elasticus]